MLTLRFITPLHHNKLPFLKIGFVLLSVAASACDAPSLKTIVIAQRSSSSDSAPFYFNKILIVERADIRNRDVKNTNFSFLLS